MKKKIAMVIGLIIMLLVIWSESYIIHICPRGSWIQVPSFLTAIIIFSIGFSIVSFNSNNDKERTQ